MEPKWFVTSKTVIGVIVSVLPVLLPSFGITFSPEDGTFVSGNVDMVIQAVGAILALYGRFVAKNSLSIAP